MISVTDLGEGYCNVPSIIAVYQQHHDEAESNLKLKGKTLKTANVEQSSWLVFYDQRRVELAIFVRLMDLEVDKVRSQLYKKYTENYSRALGDREREKYIDGESIYHDVVKIHLLFKEMHDKYVALVDGFTARGYSLKNLVDLAINELNDNLI